VVGFPSSLNFLDSGRRPATRPAGAKVRRVGIVEGAFDSPEQSAAVAANFPELRVQPLSPGWPNLSLNSFDLVIVPVSAATSGEADAAVRWIQAHRGDSAIVVVLRNADIATTRRLVHAGAADVLPAPVTDPALAISLERVLSSLRPDRDGRISREVVAFIKAGGGVGATALAVQAAALAASRDPGKVSLVDLDLQFGAAALYLDIRDAVTVLDCLEAGDAVEETGFSDAMAPHASGLRLLAGPRDLTPLEALSPSQIESLLAFLRSHFALTILDLPAVWTAWTNRALHLADRIVLVTQLSVPHISLARRQLQMLQTQGLADRPLIMVCNGLSGDQQSFITLKAAEKALGRSFDVVVPEDRNLMLSAINQGALISQVKRATKLEKAVTELTRQVVADALAPTELKR
jgi:pilus assembly protein CpaE